MGGHTKIYFRLFIAVISCLIFSAAFAALYLQGGVLLADEGSILRDVVDTTGSATSSSGSGSSDSTDTSGASDSSVTQNASGSGSGSSDSDTSATVIDNPNVTEPMGSETGATQDSLSDTSAAENSVTVSLEIVFPRNGSTLSGDVTLEAISTVPLDGLVFYFDNPNSIIVPDRTYAASGESGGLRWRQTLRTQELLNATYTLHALGYVQGRQYASGQITVFVQNVPADITFVLLQPTVTTLSGRVDMVMEADALVENAMFDIRGPQTARYPAVIDGRYLWTLWDTAAFPSGQYEVELRAVKGGQTYSSRRYVFSVINSANTFLETVAPDAQTPELEQEPVSRTVSIAIALPAEGTLSGTVTFSAVTSEPVSDLFFVVSGNRVFQEVQTRFFNGRWVADWDTRNVPDGEYRIFARALSINGVYQSTEHVRQVENINDIYPAYFIRIVRPGALENEIYSGNIRFEIDVESEIIPEQVGVRIEGYGRQIFFRDFVFDNATGFWTGTWNSRVVVNGVYSIQAAATFEGRGVVSETLRIRISNPAAVTTEIPSSGTAAPVPIGAPLEAPTEIPQGEQEAFEDFSERCARHGVNDPNECFRQYLASTGISEECARRGIVDASACQRYHALPVDCKNEGIVSKEACDRFMFSSHREPEQTPLYARPNDCSNVNARDCRTMIEEKYFPKDCRQEGIVSPDDCSRYLFKRYQPPECAARDVATPWECNEIIRQKYFEEECERQKITTSSECFDYIFERYASKVQCEGIDEISCNEIVRRRFLGISARKVKEAEIIHEVLMPFVNTSVTMQPKLQLPFSERDITSIVSIEDMVPVVFTQSTRVSIVPSESKIILSPEEKIIAVSPAVFVIDQDGDGLADDIELHLGTDVKNPDSDGDGFLDGQEVAEGFNPTGRGPLTLKMEPIEEALVHKTPLEHAKVSGKESEKLVVRSVENVNEPISVDENKDSQRTAYQRFFGTAQPNTTLALYIYSDMPLVVVTRTDEFGNWTYVLRESLREGEHEAYVTVNDNTGKIIEKSRPFSFFVKEAQAVTAQEFFAEELSAGSSLWENIKMYLFLAGIVTLLGIALVVYFLTHSKRENYF